MKHTTGTKYRLVFLTVNSSYSHSSLALPLLHSACRRLSQWEWIRYDMTIDSDIMTAVNDIYSFQCDLLVTDLYLFNRKTALEVLLRYHILDPECRIAAGGPECLGRGADDLAAACPWIHRVFRGEGEEIFCQYLEEFDDEISQEHPVMPAEGNAVFQEWASSAYPVNDPFFVSDKPFVQMETSRGCPLKCCYCTSGNTVTRYRSLEQVREELTLLEAKGVREIRILDRTFNLPRERGAALLRMFREEFPLIRFHLELHPQFLNDTLRSELLAAQPGQLHIEVGIQCLNREVQRFAGRNSNTDAVLDGLDFLCRQSTFDTHADLLAGLPGQKLEHIFEDTAVLMRYNTAEIQLEVLKALPGTPLREIAAEHDIRYSPEPPYDVMMTGTMSTEDILNVRDLSRLLDMTFNHRYLHLPVLAMSRDCSDFICRFLEYFHQAGGSAGSVWDLKKRFIFLLDFCRTYGLEKGRFELAYHWLLAGLPPGQGADGCSQRAGDIPADAVLTAGAADCIGKRETRCYMLASAEKTYYIAYNRAYALNLPAAVWVVYTGTSK